MTWGHTLAEQAVDYAIAAGVQRLALFHHDPFRTDDALDQLLAVCQRRERQAGSSLLVLAAAEGQTLELGRQPGESAPAATESAGRTAPRTTDAAPPTILVVDDDPNVARLLVATLRPEGYRLLMASDGASGLKIVRAEHLSLVLMDWQMPGMSGLEVCLALRADPDPLLRELPVVLLTSMTPKAI